MPRSNVKCKFCDQTLRIWPANIGNPFFTCKDKACASKGEEIRNNSANRFNCFACDYDVCRACGDAQEAAMKASKKVRPSSGSGNSSFTSQTPSRFKTHNPLRRKSSLKGPEKKFLVMPPKRGASCVAMLGQALNQQSLLIVDSSREDSVPDASSASGSITDVGQLLIVTPSPVNENAGSILEPPQLKRLSIRKKKNSSISLVESSSGSLVVETIELNKLSD